MNSTEGAGGLSLGSNSGGWPNPSSLERVEAGAPKEKPVEPEMKSMGENPFGFAGSMLLMPLYSASCGSRRGSMGGAAACARGSATFAPAPVLSPWCPAP